MPHLFRRTIPLCSALALLGLTGGCATSTTHAVKVDSISKPKPTDSQSYKLKSKNPALGEESLRYKEAADFVRTALSGKGLYEAPDEDAADMIVELDYGMDTPRTKVERVSVPIYAQVGGGVRYETVPVTDARGNVSYRTVAVYDTPRSELIGYDDVPRQIAVYEKYLKITARENKPSNEGRPPAELWSVHASAEDESKDLRRYLPVMAGATVDYIGRDTKHETVVKIKENGEVVSFIRRGMPDANAAPQPAPPKI
jgi:hypothetical protein